MSKQKFPKKKIAILATIAMLLGTIFGFIPKAALATTAWNAMPSTGFAGTVTAVSAVSETAVWGCGAAGSIRKYDGYNWAAQVSGVAINLWDISMASATVGICVGASDTTRGVILYTSDGGSTWTQSTDASIPNVDLSGACMASATTGWVVGQDAAGTETILKTTDGGVNWDAQTAAAAGNTDYNDVDAISTSVAVLCGESDGTRGTVFYTGDGGTTWTQHTDADIPGYGLNGVYVASVTVAFVVGDCDGAGGAGTILSTTNLSGDAWDLSADLDIPTQNLDGIDGTSTTRVWVSGEAGVMLETSDGSNWGTNVTPAGCNTIRRISAESVDHVFGSCSGANRVIASFDITAHDVQFDLGVAIDIALDSTAAYDFGTVLPTVVYTSADNVRTVTVTTNNPTGWILYIKGLGDFDDGGGNTVNLDVLEWSSDSAAWTDTTISDTIVTSDISATDFDGVDTGMEYRLNTVPFGVVAGGTFTTTITYTAATQ